MPRRVVNLQIIPKSVYQLCIQILHHFWICPFVTTHCWSNGLNGNTNITSERDYVKNKGQYINLKSMINSSDLSAESLAILFTKEVLTSLICALIKTYGMLIALSLFSK